MRKIPATWMRGGTSKCWMFRSEALASEGDLDSLLLRLFGSPDPRQIDGVGGGTSTTSKAMIVSPSQGESVDAEYRFAQVEIDRATVDWGSNCGNCSAAVALYVIEKGWATITDPVTRVRLRNLNTSQTIVFDVPTKFGHIDESATAHIPGVPFDGLPVKMWFIDPGGRTTGRLLPTGQALDSIEDPDGTVAATLIDAGAPVVAVRAEDLGLTGHETVAQLTDASNVLHRLERIRRAGAVAMGMAHDAADVRRSVPKLALVAAPENSESDIAVRMLSMGTVHPAVAITGSVAITLAAFSRGTVVSDIAGPSPHGALRLGTPVGIVPTWISQIDGRVAVAALRTARVLAEAELPVPWDGPTPSTPEKLDVR